MIHCELTKWWDSFTTVLPRNSKRRNYSNSKHDAFECISTYIQQRFHLTLLEHTFISQPDSAWTNIESLDSFTTFSFFLKSFWAMKIFKLTLWCIWMHIYLYPAKVSLNPARTYIYKPAWFSMNQHRITRFIHNIQFFS